MRRHQLVEAHVRVYVCSYDIAESEAMTVNTRPLRLQVLRPLMEANRLHAFDRASLIAVDAPAEEARQAPHASAAGVVDSSVSLVCLLAEPCC